MRMLEEAGEGEALRRSTPERVEKVDLEGDRTSNGKLSCWRDLEGREALSLTFEQEFR